jgi:preprotein translocase subunit SecG
MLQTTILIVHVFIAIGLIGLVLLQRGKGAEAGAAFGAGASGTVFGARGSASFLSRSTAVLATIFFATSMTLAYLASHRQAPQSLLEQAAPVEESIQQLLPDPGAVLPDEGAVLPEIPAAGDSPQPTESEGEESVN